MTSEEKKVVEMFSEHDVMSPKHSSFSFDIEFGEPGGKCGSIYKNSDGSYTGYLIGCKNRIEITGKDPIRMAKRLKRGFEVRGLNEIIEEQIR